MHVTLLLQTKGYVQKKSAKEVSEQCANAALPEMEDCDTAESDQQHLPTDTRSCDNSLKEPGAIVNENMHNGPSTSSSVTTSASSSSLFTPVTLFVNSQTALNELVSEQHGSSFAHNLMLTGLHTCGNLSADILQLFVATASVQVVCQVGCCYNLLTERFPPVPGTPAHGNISVPSAATLMFPD